MFKGPARLVPGTELNLTLANQKSTTKHSGSVHKTNCKGRTVTVQQVSLWKHQDCAAITGKCNWIGAKWNSCANPREQVLRLQPFPARVVCEWLQSHRPEWLQLKTPEICNGITGGNNYLVRWSKIIFWNLGIHVSEWGGQKHLVRDRKGQWGSKGSWSCYNIATCAWTRTHKVPSCPQSTETVQTT
jgi:hypothetical protein